MKFKRTLSLALTVLMLASALVVPGAAYAQELPQENGGLCPHHQEHTAECGYAPEGECTHVCSEESGCTQELCTHSHDESCGYAPAAACSYAEQGCPQCLETEKTESPESTEPTAGPELTTVTGTQEICSCTVKCSEDNINEQCPACAADGADLSLCAGESAAEKVVCSCTVKCSEDSINEQCPVCAADGADLSHCAGESAAEKAVCSCTTPCTGDGINEECPVCSAEGADLSHCAGLAAEGFSAEKPMEVPKMAMAIKNGAYYGILKTWFQSVNPNKATMYFTVTIPETVTSIANDAFRDNLTSGKQSVGAVNEYDKVGRYHITSIDFSKAVSLKTIDYQAAYGCSLLTGVLDLSNTKIEKIDKNAFGGCTGLTGVILPSTLQVLGTEKGDSGSVFNKCSGLQFVRTAGENDSDIFDLPNGLRVIGNYTFQNTFPKEANLKIHIPVSVEIVGSQAFYSNSAFSQIYIERTENYGGYHEAAFKADSSTDSLLIFPNSSAYESTGSFTRITKTYPVTLEFKNSSGTVAEQPKLYGQSIQYTQGQDGLWYIDSGYSLPETGEAGNTPGYDAGWQIYGDDKVLTNSSKVSGWQDDRLAVKIVKDTVVSKPTVEYTVNGNVVETGTGVPQLSVDVDSEHPGTVGVKVTHPLATEEAIASGTYVYFKYCWWDEKGDSVNGPRSQEEPDIFSNAPSSGSLNRVYTDRNEIDIRSATDARTDTDYYLVEIYGYYVKNNGKPTQYYKSSHNFIAGDNSTDGRAFIMNVDVTDKSPIVVNLTNITVYSGGEGHYGIIGEDGTIDTDHIGNGFPSPGYVITLPEGLSKLLEENGQGANLAGKLSFIYNDGQGESRKWDLILYGTEANSSVAEGPKAKHVYKLVPAEDGQDPVRVAVTDATSQEIVTDDNFSLSKNEKYREYDMRIYYGQTDQKPVTAELTIGDKVYKCPVESRASTLTVRGVNGGSNGEILDSESAIGAGADQVETYADGAGSVTGEEKIQAVAPAGTSYFVNGSNVALADCSGVRLLSDRVIDETTLRTYIEANLPEDIPQGSYSYEQRYIDLVDSKNGNAFLTLGNGQEITLYWPVPDDYTPGGNAFVFHFEKLKRNYSVPVDSILGDNPPVMILPEKVSVNGIDYFKFKVASFSPFVLMYESAFGSLAVANSVSGTAADTEKQFNFTVTLDDNSVNGTYGDMTFTNGVASFALKHDQSKTATGLPDGVGYTVTESEANKDGYTTTATGDKGLIAAGTIAWARFTNTKNTVVPPATGAMIVSKTVGGNAGDTGKYFSFTVVLSDKTINGWYEQMNFVDGVASFKLKHGERCMADKLPAGIAYQVYEAEANKDNYRTTSINADGTIPAGDSVSVMFSNYRAYAFGGFIPHTGDESRLGLWAAIGILALVGLAGSVIYVKRKSKGGKD